MKKTIKILIANALLIIGTIASTHAETLVQPLHVALKAYGDGANPSITIQTPQLIRYLVGAKVPSGHLYLVTPVGNTPGTTGNLNAFLRIKSGTNTVAEISSPGQFNLFQDVAALRKIATNRITSRAVNRFSIDFNGVQAEFQGFSIWNILQKTTASGVDLSGAGAFTSNVNGWISINGITDGAMPVSGIIFADPPVVRP